MSASILKNELEMNRREFVKTAAAGAAGLALMGLPMTKSEAVAKYPHSGEVVIIRDENATQGPDVNLKVVQSMLDEAIQALTKGGGWPSIIPSYKAGETVGIKVNCQVPLISTQWKVVGAVVRGLTGMGVPQKNIVIWDADSESIKYGAIWLIRGVFPEVRLTATNKLKDPFDSSKSMDILGNRTCLSRLLTDADHLINVPVLKNHFEAGITFALKNHLGSVGENIKDRQKIFHLPQEEGNRWHKILGRGRPKGEAIALINTAPDIKNKTRLIVGDALFGSCTMGPISPPDFAYNGLIVGTDPVATDHQVRLIIENERKKRNLPLVPSPHIDHAIKLGLGAPVDEMKVIPVDRTKRG
ncbi:MAG: DUF362 domain-containing protein [Planctomycetaceae bacterium]